MSDPHEPSMTPGSILNSSGCFARTLTISDNHATILLTNNEENKTSGKETTLLAPSLLKLTVEPFHRAALNPPGMDSNAETEASDINTSSRILSFLKEFDFLLSSESGAEYSYFSASQRRPGILSTLWSLVSVPSMIKSGCFKAELISPASERQIQRAMPSPAAHLVNETPELYNKVTMPYIQSIVQSGSLSWIQNILDGTKEKERLLLDNDSFLLNIDTKWRSHPDPNVVSRKEWNGHPSVRDLYCLAIFKQSGVASLRDLRGSDHLAVLKTIVKECPKAIEDIYGVPPDQLRMFVHYQPQFFQFHIHFTRLENSIGCQVERGHLVTDIIQNLEIDSAYYTKRTITYTLKITDKLYQAFEESKRG